METETIKAMSQMEILDAEELVNSGDYKLSEVLEKVYEAGRKMGIAQMQENLEKARLLR